MRVARRDVAVTGVGAVTPLGTGAETLIDQWTSGICGIEGGLGRCADFDPSSVLDRKEIRRSDRYTQFALVAAAEASRQAGWDAGVPFDPMRVASVIGTGIGGLATMGLHVERSLQNGGTRVPLSSLAGVTPNGCPAAISLRYGLRGPSLTVASACAAGSHAIGTALRLIQWGEVDAVITGGSEAALTPLARRAFEEMRATSRVGISRPFDARRDGFVMGEGAAVLILEEASAAAERGAEIIGTIRGYGTTVDAFDLTAPEPRGDGAARAIRLALDDAGVAPGEIVYVNAHGTSTQLNDLSETMAIKQVLDAAATPPVSSTKSAIGHTLGAAGAIDAIATLLALRRRVAPPTLGYAEPDPALDLDYVPERACPLRTNGAGPAIGVSNSFGFGGHNAVLCLAA